MVETSYQIPTGDVFYEESIKRGKFFVSISHTPDLEAVKKFLGSGPINFKDCPFGLFMIHSAKGF